MSHETPQYDITVEFLSDSSEGSPKLTLTGVELSEGSKVEKIRKIMEVLDLPEGTKARIVHTTSDVVVR